jgi:MFS superfamily sulfate permease-like transporter
MNFKEFIGLIQTPEWSWPLIGIGSVFLALILRSLLLADVLHRMRIHNSKWYKHMLTEYQPRAVVSWIFFALFVGGSIAAWRFESFVTRYIPRDQIITILFAFLVLWLLLQMRAYARSIVESVSEQRILDRPKS